MARDDHQRAELSRALRAIAEDGRDNGVAAIEYRDYILGFLFYRYLSEHLQNRINAWEHKSGNKDFQYADLDDKAAGAIRDEMVDEVGFYIAPSQLFDNVLKKAHEDPSALNEKLQKAFTGIEQSTIGRDSEDDFRGTLTNMQLNSEALGGTVTKRNQRLLAWIDQVAKLNLGDAFSKDSIDAFGDAYEQLMGMYSSAGGKEAGKFYTPQDIARLLTEITVIGKKKINKAYDPACGSASLLLNYAKVLGRDRVEQGYFGQDIDHTTFRLARMNMILHDVGYNRFNISYGDTLTDPKHEPDEPFEAIVSNPPFSISWIGDDDPTLINDPRFAPAGKLAPKHKMADLAFTMHALAWLAGNGTAAIMQFPGALYRKRAEETIRKYLVDNNFVSAVIALPRDMFYGTPINTEVLVLQKGKVDDKVMFIDARELYEPDPDRAKNSKKKNRLTDAGREQIIQALTDREAIPHFAAMVDQDAIAATGYNLIAENYVEAVDKGRIIDIDTLEAEIDEIVARQSKLRSEIKKIVTKLRTDDAESGHHG